MAAQTRISVFVPKLRPRAGAFEGQSALPQRLERCRVVLRARALVFDRAVPLKAESLQRVEYSGGGAGYHSGTVQVLDSNQPAAVVGPGIQAAGGRRVQ